MAVKVLIPTPIRKFTENLDTVTVQEGNIKGMIAELLARYPGVNKSLLDDSGKLRKFVNVYVNGEDIRFLQGDDTPLNEGDEVSIVPAIAGGAS